jgi:predicted MFS family arabinose efflux permease
MVVYGSVVIVCRIVFAKVPDRLPSLPLAAASLVAIGVGLLIAAVMQDPAGLLIGVVILAVGVTFSTPAFFSAIFATAKPSERGAAAGTASAFIDLAFGFGPITLGVVASAYGIPWAMAVGAGIAFVGAGWTASLARRARPDGALG